MNKALLLSTLSMLVLGCATSSPQTRQVLQSPPNVPPEKFIENIAFTKQIDGDCGPAALKSIMNRVGYNVSLAELQAEVYTPGKKGSLQMDLVSASRRRGFLAVPIYGFSALLQELANDQPVIVFQNLAFGWAPQWHYAVVTGYDLKKQEVAILSEKSTHERTPMTYFERHWQHGEYWGLLILPPDKMSVSADELSHMRAAAGLELVGKFNEAEGAYKNILDRWPQSLSAYIGLGNISYQRHDYVAAVRLLKQAVKLHPTSDKAKHNLAVAEKRLKTKAKK